VDSNPATAVDPLGLAPTISCPTCGRQSAAVTNAGRTFCDMAKNNKGCREALRYFGPPGGLLPCVETKCATQINVACITQNACGNCGGPCNALSDPTAAVYLQPLAFTDICGGLGDTFAHEMAHLCGIGEDAGSGAGQKKNQRDAETVARLCRGF